MSLYFIGDFQFFSLSRPPSLPKQRTEREVRPGTDGVSLWRTGRRGEPFTVNSSRDVSSIEAAVLFLTSYQAFQGGDPVEIVWADHEYQSLLVYVHDVEPIEDRTHAVLLGIGGVNGTSGAILRCTWVLEPINNFRD
jgi:hypothetical protein